MSTPAAQYLRMSTDLQKYSFENQRSGIADYALAHDFEVVQTYSDAAKSGLLMKNRNGLKTLLRDVVQNPPYRAILVYDVSRWGRFQDVDESAYYEFICKSAGVPVHYCAELFRNDNSVMDSIFKSLKRAMAAEYSRELGEKVYAGQKRLILLGYKMGGKPTYGLRRLLLSADGNPKQLLRTGQRKSLEEEHVVLIPGPAEEVAVVRRIFAMAIAGDSPIKIADTLNVEGVPFAEFRKSWAYQNVRNLIKNPVYTGRNTWGRSNQRLHRKIIHRPPSEWVFRPDAFTRFISQEVFEEAQRALKHERTDEELLQLLRDVWEKEGSLSQQVLATSRRYPSYTNLRTRFGSFQHALKLIGYQCQVKSNFKGAKNSHLRKLRTDLLARLKHLFPNRIELLVNHRSSGQYLRLDGSLPISITLAVPRQTSAEAFSWRMQPRKSERSNLTLVCYLDTRRKKVDRMYFVQGLPAAPRILTISPEKETLRHWQLRQLRQFCSLACEITGGVQSGESIQ
jgi:DNA invertase Pin-like site-specific DNA recombinase